MTESNQVLDFSDADLKASLQRAFRNILILGLVLAALVGVAAGWQSGVLLLIGAIVSASGVWEWRRLLEAVNDKLDNKENARSTGPVVLSFFLRLLLAAGVLYGSLKCFHGSIYALVAGLCLAVIGLTIEAVRLIRV